MLQVIVDWFVYSVLGMLPGARFAESVNFFIYDSIKILILLFVMIAAIGFLRTYIPHEKVKRWLSGEKRIAGNFGAALFGAATPFCSCSSIPIFLGFMEVGVPLGVAFSFLITSPLVNEYLVVLMLGFFGWKLTAAYVASGIIMGTVAGMILGRMKLEKHLVKDLVSTESNMQKEIKYDGWKKRLRFGLNEAKSIIVKLWIWILVGVGVGAAIHNYIPAELIQKVIEGGGAWTVPVATLIGVPLYGSCAAILPIAVALFQKGLPIGTALAFMMAISGLSLPEAVILRRAMKLKLILIFFGIVTVGIIITGYLFNLLQGVLI
jgi:uncharacterized membrane protein YraQ (UPF0718 family)